MALTFTPEGRQVWIPDQFAPLQEQELLAPPPFLQEPPAPQQIGPAGNLGSVAEVAQPPSPQGLPPPEPPPPLPQPAPTPPQQAPGFTPPVQSTPDFSVNVETDPKVLAAKVKAEQREQAAATTPQSLIAQGTQEQQGVLARAADVTRAAGQAEAAGFREQAAIEKEGQTRLEESQRQLARQQELYEINRHEKQQEVKGAVDAWRNYKIDDNRRWHDMGTGKTILFWISAALSGLGDALQKKSGTNNALKMMDDAIARDVDAQIRDREKLGQAVGYARTSLDDYVRIAGGDLATARNIKIAENKDWLASELRQNGARYQDPAVRAKAEQAALKNEFESAGLKAQAAESIARLNTERQRLGLEFSKFAQHKYEFEENKKLQQQQIDAAKEKAKLAGKDDLAKMISEKGIGGTIEHATTADGKPLFNPDGTPQLKQATLIATLAGKERRDKLAGQKAAADMIIQVVDETIKARLDSGWQSDIANSPVLQQQKQNWASVVLTAKNLLDLGQIQGGDQALIDKWMGTTDPTKLRDMLPGIRQMRKNLLRTVNADWGTAGMVDEQGRPAKYNPADPNAQRIEETAEETAFKRSLQEPEYPIKISPLNPVATAKSALKFVESGGGEYESGKAAQAQYVQSLISIATDPNASQSKRDAAFANLKRGAAEGHSEDIQDMFRGAYSRAEFVRRAQEGLAKGRQAP